MSLTLTAGQVFTGGSIVGTDTGQIAFTQVGSVTFNTSVTPNTITQIQITKDILGSSQSFQGATLESVTITSVTPNSIVQLTTDDLPPGITVPSGFTLPQNDTGTVIGFDANVSLSGSTPFTLAGTAGLIGVDGSLVLVGDVHVGALTAGAAVLSLGGQTTGDGLNEVFTPVVSPACFASGTHIETPDGEVAVEALREGQHVITASGRSAPVVWLGNRSVYCRQYPCPQDVWPMRVSAGAFGPDQPHRDLLLSPDHAVFVDGALIPIRYLVNDVTVAQQKIDEVTYWHVELARHEVLLAEGLACESYLDTGNRGAFEDGNIAWVVAARA
jgi:hypothetical protein